MATRQAQRYMPIRGPRFTDRISVAQAGQAGGTLGELAWGAAAIFEALEGRSDREQAQAMHEHDQAGELAAVRAKNDYQDWLTQLQTREDFYAMGSSELLKLQNRKIGELVGGLAQWEDKAEQLDLDLSIIASRPVAKRREREHTERQAGIFAELKRLEGQALEKYSDYARAFARAGPEESEALYQEWQVRLEDVRRSRKLAVGMDGWTPEARAEIETELDGATRALMRDAFREKAVLEGTVGDLYGHVANRTDSFGPEGARLFEGVAPEEVAEMRALDSRRASSRMAREEAENRAEKQRIKDAQDAQHLKDSITIANADNELEAALAISEQRRREGDPNADALLEKAKKRAEVEDDVRNLILADDSEAQTKTWGLVNRAMGEDEDGLLDVERIVDLSGPEGNWTLNPDQQRHVERVVETRRARLDTMSDAEREASRKYQQEIRPILGKYYGFLAETQPVFDKGAEAQIGIRAMQLAQRVEESYLQGDQGPEDRARHAAILEFMLYGQFGDSPYSEKETMDQSMERLDRLLYGLYDSGEQPKTEVELVRMALPPDLTQSLLTTPDGTKLLDMDEQVEYLTYLNGGDRKQAMQQATAIIAWRQLDRRLRAGGRPGQIRGERAEAMKAIRYMPSGTAALADEEYLEAVRNQ